MGRTPWKSCERERAAVSVIDEQTRLDTFAQSCKGGWRDGIASSSGSGGSSLGISLYSTVSLKGGHRALGVSPAGSPAPGAIGLRLLRGRAKRYLAALCVAGTDWSSRASSAPAKRYAKRKALLEYM